MHRSRLLLVVAAMVALVAATTPAHAYFRGRGWASAPAAVGSLDAPRAVQASVTAGSTTVRVRWDAPGAGALGALDGYRVQRIVGTTRTGACGTASSLLDAAATACDDNDVDDGSYTYEVTAVFRSWTRTSAASNAVTVHRDADAPAAAILFPVDGQAYNTAGYGAGCAPRPAGFCGTASDPSGVARVLVAIVNDAGASYDGHAFTATPVFLDAMVDRPGATATAWHLALASLADGAYTAKVRTIDAAQNSQPSNAVASAAAFTIDTAAPTVLGVVLADGGTPLMADTNDTVSIAMSEPLRARSICSSWTDDSQNHTLNGAGDVTVKLLNYGDSDRVNITSRSCVLNVGVIELGSDYAFGTVTFNGTGANASTLTWNAATRTLVIRLGTRAGGVRTGVAAGKATYRSLVPEQIADLAGNLLTGTFTETVARTW